MISNKLRENGQVLVVIALASIVLFGFVALAIDGTAKFSDRRRSQNAADTAALAAALSKVNSLTAGVSDKSPSTGAPTTCPPPSGVLPSPVCEALQLAGLDRAVSNGYSNNLTTSTVEIYSPPISGYYSTVSNKAEYVQVIITSHIKTYFARVIGINQTNNIVQAVALAKPGKNLAEGAMIISYDPDPGCSSGLGAGGGSVDVIGASNVTLTGGGILLNSDETCGFTIPNCANLNLIAQPGQPTPSITSVGTVDNINQDGCVEAPENFDPSSAIKIPDEVYWPDVPKECSKTPLTPVKLGEVMAGSPPKLTEEWLIYPGFYTDFPSPGLVANKSHIYMKSGVYCIDPPMNQDLSWSPIDAAILNGSTESNPSKKNYNKYHAQNPDGVTLYIKAGGGFTINSNNPTYLDASTSGDLQGYLIVLEGTQTDHPSCSITGGADIHLDGMVFAPYCNIKVNGGSDSVAPINAQLIGWHITIDGKAGVNFNYDPSNQVHIKRRVGLMK